MKVDLVVLDIAGTTVQEHGLVYKALADTVIAAGGAADDVGSWMGADKYEAISSMLGRSEVDAEFADFHERLAKSTPRRRRRRCPACRKPWRGCGRTASRSR